MKVIDWLLFLVAVPGAVLAAIEVLDRWKDRDQ